MRPQSAKAKGRIWQKTVAEMVRGYFGLQEDDVVSRPMGSGGVDLMMSPLAQQKIGVSFECKKTTVEPTLRALEQARHNAYPNSVGVVAWQPRGMGGDRGVVTLDIHDFLELLRRANG